MDVMHLKHICDAHINRILKYCEFHYQIVGWEVCDVYISKFIIGKTCTYVDIT
jgi:hypothetical protein